MTFSANQPTSLLVSLTPIAVSTTGLRTPHDFVALIKTVPLEQAIWEPGFFANQNSACRLRNRFTIDRLTARFGLNE